jgi:hypothetical protein
MMVAVAIELLSTEYFVEMVELLTAQAMCESSANEV